MELVKEQEKRLEEIVMAMKTRSDLMPFKTGINTAKLPKLSLMLQFPSAI